VPDGDYARDADGLLYEPAIRDSLRSALPGGQLALYEALLALRRAAFVLDRQTKAIRNIAVQHDPGMRVLIRLHGEPSGVPVADLVADRGEAVLAVLDGLDREGMLVRVGASVRLSELGSQRLDEVLRQLSDSLAALVDGVPDEQLALLRHISLWLILNHDRLRSG
jgi:hypothetical protein